MKKFKQFATVAMVGLIFLLVAGCGNDRYDKLKVVDGNGRVLILEHSFGATYFIRAEVSEQPTLNSKINAKLKSATGN